MDKIVAALKKLWQGRFWLGCSLIAITTLIVCYLAIGWTTSETSKNVGAIKSSISSANNVLNTGASLDPSAPETITAHPNKQTQTKMNEKLGQVSDKVLEAWRELRTKQETLYVWPSQLNENTKKSLAAIQPPEAVNSEIRDAWKDNYTTNIPDRMPELATIIGAKWNHKRNVDDDGPTVQTETSTDADELEVVQWGKDNQLAWNGWVTNFSRDGNEDMRPTTLQILLLQQDLWLLEAMLNIIKEVNGDADENDLASIRTIDHILIGRPAVVPNIEILTISPPPKTALAEQKKRAAANEKIGKRGGIKRKERGISGGASKPRRGGPAKKKAVSLGTGPLAGRYVDMDYEPLSDKQIKSAATTKKLSENPELIVAKRIPIRIGVLMDERKIGQFMTAAANSDFTFEIRQVRVNTHEANAFEAQAQNTGGGKDKRKKIGTGKGGGGKGLSGEGTGSRNRGKGTGGETPPGPGGMSTGGPPEQRTDYFVKVEFFGIVKLYNPVRPEVFKFEADGAPSAMNARPGSGQVAGRGAAAPGGNP